MTSTLESIVFTATATAGTVFQTQLPLSASHSTGGGVTKSILGGGVNPIEFHPTQ